MGGRNQSLRSSNRLRKTENQVISKSKPRRSSRLLRQIGRELSDKEVSGVARSGLFALKAPTNPPGLQTISATMKELGIDNMKTTDYIPSVIDKPHLVSVATLDLLSEFGGRGLFAKTRIRAGTCLGVYTGKQFSEKAFETYLHTTKEAGPHYAMLLDSTIIDAQLQGNFTRYINFSDTQANVEFISDFLNGEKIVKVVATKHIQAGQQILIDYGTYSEEVSADYFFLNPEDNWQSAAKTYTANQDLYQLYQLKESLPCLGLKVRNRLYLTEVSRAIIEGNSLRNSQFVHLNKQLALPCLYLKNANNVLDFAKKDTWSALMLACYLGQLDNVNWLIEHAANVNQQQHQSGLCPLFIALEQYAHSARNSLATERRCFKQIILSLLKHGAAYTVHDREDRIFVAKALSVLSYSDFKEVFELIRSDIVSMEEFISYLDNNDDDIIMYAIKNKRHDQLELLLTAYPEYFTKYYTQETRSDFERLFKAAIANYEEEDLNDLSAYLLPFNCNDELEVLALLGEDFTEYRVRYRDWTK